MENNTQDTNAVVQKAFEAIQEFQGKKTSGKNSWIAGIAAGILTLVALSLLFWKLFQNGKKQAKIAHERDMFVEKELQAVVDSQVSENVEEKGKLLDQAAEHRAAANEARKELLQVRLENIKTNELIDSLKTWEDVDKYLAGKSE